MPIVAALTLACTACSPASSDHDDAADEVAAEPMWLAIASPNSWTETPLADDPFADQRPADATCEPSGHGIDDLGGDPAYEIDTGLCNYLSISQPCLRELPAGTSVEFRVWHFELEAAVHTSAEAYLALDIAGNLVFEQTVPIPSDSELITGEFELPVDVPVGAPMTVHLHNHGANTWDIVSIDALL